MSKKKSSVPVPHLNTDVTAPNTPIVEPSTGVTAPVTGQDVAKDDVDTRVSVPAVDLPPPVSGDADGGDYSDITPAEFGAVGDPVRIVVDHEIAESIAVEDRVLAYLMKRIASLETLIIRMAHNSGTGHAIIRKAGLMPYNPTKEDMSKVRNTVVRNG